ncbi:hypothetical protein AKO1_009158 [Acrasis kona]|uniref:Uncharacterized protein n=1 Tax=Acrasis kona TaxID=1008807 RepID=A0AAW2ZKW4_9EUKA
MNTVVATSHVMNSIKLTEDIQTGFDVSELLNDNEVVRTSDDEEENVIELYGSDNEELIDYCDEDCVVDDYQQKSKARVEKWKQMEHHIKRSGTVSLTLAPHHLVEFKFGVGKFMDSYNDMNEAHKIAEEINVDDATLYKILLHEGRSKFKMGDTQQSLDYLTRAKRIDATDANLLQLIKEVEHIIYFEGMIDPLNAQHCTSALVVDKKKPSKENALHSVNCIFCENVRHCTPYCSHFISQSQYKSGRTSNSWQNSYLLYNKKHLYQDAKS